jgi:hypothetical protein
VCLLCQEEQFCLYSKMSDPELLNSGAFCLLEQRPPEVGDVWKLSILQFLAVGVGCLALGYWVGKKRGALRHLPPSLEKPKYHGKEQTHDVEKLAEKFEDFKMVLVVRNDLKMGKGKVAAQCRSISLLLSPIYRCRFVPHFFSSNLLVCMQERLFNLPCHISFKLGQIGALTCFI